MPADTLTPSLREPPAPASAAAAADFAAPNSSEGSPIADPQPEAAGIPAPPPDQPSGRSHRVSPGRAVEGPMTGREIALSIALVLFGIAFTTAVVYVYLAYL